jgi:large subunit ribosomal protein L17
MHRHGYQGRKFGRQTDQRRALIKGLADSLVLREAIETTLPKAKEVVSYTEKLITKAKKGDLHNRRQIMASLETKEAAFKLVDELAPKLKARTSGHLRIEKTSFRRGDAAQLARVSFVDELKAKAEAPKPAAPKKPARPPQAAARRRATKKDAK